MYEPIIQTVESRQLIGNPLTVNPRVQMTTAPPERYCTDLEWWSPPLFNRTDELIGGLGDIIENGDISTLEDFCYPERPSRAIKREFKRFEIIPIYSYDAECLGYDTVFIIRDKRYRQSALISNYISSGCNLIQRLDNLRSNTVWAAVINHLCAGSFTDRIYSVNKTFDLDAIGTMDIYDYAFWVSDFTFYGSASLDKKFRTFVECAFANAPAKSSVFIAAKNANEWLEKAGIQ